MYAIDLKLNEIVHKFDLKLRRDSKLLLAKGKGIILEPFRTKKMYSFSGNRIKEIPVSDELVQLDAMEKCLNYNALMILCEKRHGLKLVKYIRFLDLDTYDIITEDVELAGQT